MSPQIPTWVLGYTAAAGFGFAVLTWRIATVTPPLEFTLLASYGYLWLAFTFSNRVARRIDGEPLWGLINARS